jgi:hypothetical protein
MSPQAKAEFENQGAGVVGAVTIEPGTGKHSAVPVRPGETIWLSEDEQIATANAPKRDQDNPFVNGSLVLKTDPKQIANRRPIGHSEAEQVPQSDAQKEAAAKAREEQKAKALAAKKQEEEAQAAREQKAAERAEQAQKQAQAGATPVAPTQSDVSPSGTPRAARGKATQGGGGAPAKGAGVAA